MKPNDKIWPKKGELAMWWDGVWDRQPNMRETAQTYLHWLLTGRFGHRRSWATVRTFKSYLKTLAEFLEKSGKTSFADLTPPLLQGWWKAVGKTETNRAVLETAMRMCACRGLPHLPVNPLQGMLAANFVVSVKITQTEPIDDDWWAKILQRALSYEEKAHRFAEWRQEKNYEDPWAMENGIRDFETQRRFQWEVRMAGIVLVLAFTAMRRSELCALRTGALECLQRKRLVWVIWGTVFKFFGEGERARWVCGEIGRRGYSMLAGLAEKDGRLVTKSLKAVLSEKLLWWLELQQFDKDPSFPELHPHQFRRTLARLLIVEDDITLVAIKAQFKHKTTVMTEYYVGSDGHLLAKCLEREPLLAMSLTDLKKEAGTDE